MIKAILLNPAKNIFFPSGEISIEVPGLEILGVSVEKRLLEERENY
jgi:hypothetical protein